MSISAESLLLKVETDVDKAKDKLKEIGNEGEGMGTRFLKAGAVMAGGLLTAGAALVGLVGFINSSREAAQEEENNLAQMNAAIASTKGAAGLSSQGLQDLAKQLSLTSKYTKETWEQSETMMLQFTHIGKDTFPLAQQAAGDLASRLGIGLASASRLVGMALNDPINGMGRLTRFIGPVDDATKKLIATYVQHGETAKAQGVLLDLLSSKFGGSMKASVSTFEGQMALLNNALDDTKQEMGSRLLPVLSQLLTALQPVILAVFDLATKGFGLVGNVASNVLVPALKGVQSLAAGPLGAVLKFLGDLVQYLGLAMSNWGQILIHTIQPGLDMLGKAFSNVKGPGIDFHDLLMKVWGVLQGLDPFFAALGDAFNHIVAAVVPMLPHLKDLATRFLTLGTPVSLVVTHGKNLWQAFQSLMGALGGLMPHLKNLTDAFTKNVLPALVVVWGWIQQVGGIVLDLALKFASFLLPILGAVAGFLIDVLSVAINVVAAVIKFLIPIVIDLGNWFGKHLSPLIQDVSKALGELHQWFNKYVLPIIIQVVNYFNANVAPVLKFIAKIIAEEVVAQLQALWGFIQTYVLPILGKLADFVIDTIVNNFITFGKAVKGTFDFIGQLIDNVKKLIDWLGSLKDKLVDVYNNIKNSPLGGLLSGGLPHFAGGGTTDGRPFVAAEQGMELLALPGVYNAPAGSRVYTASQTAAILGNGGGGSLHFENHFHGSNLTVQDVVREQNWQAALHGGGL